MRRILGAALLVLCPIVARAAEAPAPKLAELGWLAGSWTTTQGDTRIEEHWTTPSENAMIGLGRTLKGERTGSCARRV